VGPPLYTLTRDSWQAGRQMFQDEPSFHILIIIFKNIFLYIKIISFIFKNLFKIINKLLYPTRKQYKYKLRQGFLEA
jgi:hypothetical protein